MCALLLGLEIIVGYSPCFNDILSNSDKSGQVLDALSISHEELTHKNKICC